MGDRIITAEQAEALSAQLAAEALAVEMVRAARARALRQSEIAMGVCGLFFLASLILVLCLSIGVVTF